MRVVSGGGTRTSSFSSGYRDAETLMKSKGISEIRKLEQKTKHQIQEKKKELRQLVGNRYRDLIDSVDSILSMKSSCLTISLNISSIISLFASSITSPSLSSPSSNATIYWIACRVKFLVDSPENIWACLDESMFLEAASRYTRARHVQLHLRDLLLHSDFPLLNNYWLLVDSFKSQISQRSRDLLLSDPSSLPLSSFADALAAVAVIDDLSPSEVLSLFLNSRLSWISLRKVAASSGEVVSFFCQVIGVIQVTIGQVGELFLRVLNDMPLFYRVVLGSPPASQLFGGIPNPDEEVRLWNLFRDKLESVMVLLDKVYIARTCFNWLRGCGAVVVGEIDGSYLVDTIASGRDLASAEKLIRETLDSKQVLEGSLDWLSSVFGSATELPWSRIRELVLQNECDLWDEIFEDSFVRRMKSIIDEGFQGLVGGINLGDIVRAIGDNAKGDIDFHAYLSRPSTGCRVWFIEPNAKKSSAVSGSKGLSDESDFESCLGAYFGPDVSRLRDSVETHCQSVLEDVLLFFESPKAALRLKDLAPFLQDKCYHSISAILGLVKRELDNNLYATTGDPNPGGQSVPQATVVERSLFIGRLLFAFQNHLKHVPRIFGSPRFWVTDDLIPVFDRVSSTWRHLRVVADSPVSSGPGRQMLTGVRRNTSFVNAALLGVSESSSPKLEEVSRTMRDQYIRAYGLWISWLSNELSTILTRDLGMDDSLFATTPSRGWEEIVVKQEQSDVSKSEMRIYLPSMPSLYVISFLFRACEEIHRIGGHVLKKSILQQFARKLLEKVVDIYEDFLSNGEANSNQVSDKGVLQILLDIRFAIDVLSGGDSNSAEELSRSVKVKIPFRRKQEPNQTKSILRERINGITSRFSQCLDPIDWLTYEPYLWENEKQSYLRHAVLFGFFVQLNRKYTDAVQKLATNSESNIMRCSAVPRFKYLPISAPALSSRGTSKAFLPAFENVSSRNSWKGYTNGEVSLKNEVDDNSSFGVAAPILKSFMQVGSRFGESTLKLGSMLTDGQVGIFKDRSAAAMSTFGDVLPAQAAGLLSSFTANRLDS